MMQSRVMSLVEAIANVVVGYMLAVLTQLLVFPWFGLPADIADSLYLGGIFTAVSLGRGYCLRRIFVALQRRSTAARIGCQIDAASTSKPP